MIIVMSKDQKVELRGDRENSDYRVLKFFKKYRSLMTQTSKWGIIGAYIENRRMDSVYKDHKLLSLITSIRANVNFVPETNKDFTSVTINLKAGPVTVENLVTANVKVGTSVNSPKILGELLEDETITFYLYNSEFVTNTLDENKHILSENVSKITDILAFQSSHAVFESITISDDQVKIIALEPYTVSEGLRYFKEQCRSEVEFIKV